MYYKVCLLYLLQRHVSAFNGIHGLSYIHIKRVPCVSLSENVSEDEKEKSKRVISYIRNSITHKIV